MNTDVSELKIFKYLAPAYDDKLHYEIDFTAHLLPEIALHKEVSYHLNGRPNMVEYYDELGDKMAQIRFEITADDSNLITLKKSWLAYVKNDGTITDEVLIKRYIFDPIRHATLRIQERIEARSWISSNIQIIAAGNLAFVLQKPITEIEALTNNYFLKYDVEIRFFVSKGNTAWLESLENDDLSEYADWMLNIPAWGGANLREYIIARLSY